MKREKGLCQCVFECACVCSFLIRALFSFSSSVLVYIPIFRGFTVYLKENKSVRCQGYNMNYPLTFFSFDYINLQITNVGNSEEKTEIQKKIKGLILF